MSIFVTSTASFKGGEQVVLEIVLNMMWSCSQNETIEFDAHDVCLESPSAGGMFRPTTLILIELFKICYPERLPIRHSFQTVKFFFHCPLLNRRHSFHCSD